LTQAGSVTGQSAEGLLKTGVDEGELKLVDFDDEQAMKKMLIKRKDMKRRDIKFIGIFSFVEDLYFYKGYTAPPEYVPTRPKRMARGPIFNSERVRNHPLHDS
jgi:hypothetical protein